MSCLQELHPLPPPEKSKDDILLFFKLYDPEKEQLRYFEFVDYPILAFQLPNEILALYMFLYFPDMWEGFL